jgi:acyl dehydratase/ubiquinone/menaquinone biosynthesis C-methylase UbiE
MTQLDASSAVALYRNLADTYDLATAWLEPYRRRAVSELRLQPGDVVLDVGCGTGMSFAPIQAAIGPAGRLVGIEPSPEMLSRASERVRAAGWTNVTLLEACAEEAAVPVRADAALFAFTHDVLRSPEALANVLGQVREGGRTAAAGPKWAPLAPPLNLMVWQVANQFVTTFEGFSRPWSELERIVPTLSVEEACFGCVYVAWGRLPGAPVTPRHVHVDELASHAGQHLGFSAWRQLTQEDVTRYALLTDDEQWIHVDPERAANGPYGATVAHGFFTLGLFTAMAREVLVVDGVETTINYGLNRVRFPAPARVGDRLRLGLAVGEVEHVGGGVQVVFEATFEVEGQDKPACVAQVIFRYYPQPPA